MSLTKKSDLKNHLSRRRGRTLLPFRPANPPSANNLGIEHSDGNRNTSDSRHESGLASSPAMPITAINALTGSGTDASAINKPQA